MRMCEDVTNYIIICPGEDPYSELQSLAVACLLFLRIQHMTTITHSSIAIQFHNTIHEQVGEVVYGRKNLK
jgi:hypothetical protein